MLREYRYRCRGNNDHSIWLKFYLFTHFTRKKYGYPPFLFHETFSYWEMEILKKLKKTVEPRIIIIIFCNIYIFAPQNISKLVQIFLFLVYLWKISDCCWLMYLVYFFSFSKKSLGKISNCILNLPHFWNCREPPWTPKR